MERGVRNSECGVKIIRNRNRQVMRQSETRTRDPRLKRPMLYRLKLSLRQTGLNADRGPNLIEVSHSLRGSSC